MDSAEGDEVYHPMCQAMQPVMLVSTWRRCDVDLTAWSIVEREGSDKLRWSLSLTSCN